MNDQEKNFFFDSEDTLSLRDLSLHGEDKDSEFSPLQSSATFSSEELFEFFSGSFSSSNEDQLNEYQKRDYLSVTRTPSFKKPQNYLVNPQDRSARFTNSDSNLSKNCSSVSKVNITSLTSMSAKSRRRMFMFGPVKFKPEMELKAIKERQGRRVQTTMFPVGEVVSGGGGGKKGYWGIVRSLRGRSHLVSMLAKSFGCMSMPLPRM